MMYIDVWKDIGSLVARGIEVCKTCLPPVANLKKVMSDKTSCYNTKEGLKSGSASVQMAIKPGWFVNYIFLNHNSTK